MPIISVKKISKVYGRGHTAVSAVREVSFEVAAGEIVLIMGPSGSGKTTLLTMIGGLLRPTNGEVQVNGTEITALSKKKLSDFRLHDIGFVFQSFNVLQNLTALENVQYAGQLAKLSGGEARGRATKLLTRLHLEQRLHSLPRKLSGGEQQRVSVARALMNNPVLVLADEPTGNLDSRSGHEVMMLFHNIAKEEGRSVVIVSHDPRIKDIADRTLWIEDGQISTEPPQALHTVPDPVCHMPVDAQHAPFSKNLEGVEYKFCSRDCLQKFVEHPYKYIDRLK